MRTCRVCGCSDHYACIVGDTGETCHWVEPDLCSACAAKDEPLIVLATEGDANALLRALRG